MEMNFTIPVNESFEFTMANPACGCPLCHLYRRLEEGELERILGAAMMEPDVRIRTNEEGFCRTHYDMMLPRKNRLGMALTLESHLADLAKEIHESPLSAGSKAIGRIEKLENTCYVCNRIRINFEKMADTVAYLWKNDEEFRKKLAAQPYFCLPHYKLLLEVGRRRLGKHRCAPFAKACADVVERYLGTLQTDVSWFCKKFDYRFDKEPWGNSKDAVERAVKFLRSDLHVQKGNKE